MNTITSTKQNKIKCECPCGCKASLTYHDIDAVYAIINNQYDVPKVMCPMCAKDVHRSAWL